MRFDSPFIMDGDQTSVQTLAFQLVETVLACAHTPELLPEKTVERIRTALEARFVALWQCQSRKKKCRDRLLAFIAEPNTISPNSLELEHLVKILHESEEAGIYHSGNGDNGNFLPEDIGETAFFLPVKHGNQKIGELLLIDPIIDESWVQKFQILKNLTPMIARILLFCTNGETRKQIMGRDSLRSCEDRELFRRFYENLPLGLYRASPDGHILMANSALAKMLGYRSIAEFLNCHLRQEDLLGDYPRKNLKKLLRNKGKVWGFETSIKRKDGSCLSVQESVWAIHNSRGELLYFEGSMEDLTVRKQMEQALQEVEGRLQFFSHYCREGIFIHHNGTISDVNHRGAMMFGYMPEELRGMQALELASPQSRQLVIQNIQTGYDKPYEAFGLRKDGRVFPGEWIDLNINWKGKPARVILIRDITERKRVEKKIVHLNQVLRAIRNVNQLIVQEKNPKHLIRKACLELTRTRGYSSAWIVLLDERQKLVASAQANVGKKFAILTRLIRQGRLNICGQEALLRPGVVIIKDTENRCRDCPLYGEEPQYRAMTVRLESHGKVYGLLSVSVPTELAFDLEEINLFEEVSNDIAFTLFSIESQQERKKAEEALQESEKRYSILFQFSNDGIFLHDLNGNILDVNQRIFEQFGYTREEILSLKIGDLHPPEMLGRSREAFEEIMRNGHVRFEIDFLKKNGETFPAEVSSNILEVQGEKLVQGIVRDIIERKRAEEKHRLLEAQLRQAQKMESVGRLAGGVAHDFNNMLSVITGYGELAKERLTPEDPLYHDLEEVLKAANKSKDLIHQLLAFARQQTIEPKILNLNEIVRQSIKMLRRLLREDIDLQFFPGENLWNVKLDPSQIDQILVNLTVNARDAIDRVGTIVIETENIHLNKAYCKVHRGFKPGNYVRLSFSDSGMGMTKEIQEHIFEPFYTTKGESKGTGLGMATIYGIVKQNNGFINVYSEPGQGTTFKIYLPRYTGKQQKRKEKIPSSSLKGEETILLVEDEPQILSLCKSYLEKKGYQVLTARQPVEAIQLCKNFKNPIHLLVSDVVMPMMSGKDLKIKLEKLKPGMKTLFMSGYTRNVITHQGVLKQGVHFIEKPFRMNQFVEKIRQILTTDEA